MRLNLECFHNIFVELKRIRKYTTEEQENVEFRDRREFNKCILVIDSPKNVFDMGVAQRR